MLPEVVASHRIVAPDLPAHGATGGEDERLDQRRVLDWLGALLRETSAAPPVLVGHVLGGALAARYAAGPDGGTLRGLVLVDALGLDRFRPSLRFLLGLLGFQARPSERTYRWFMNQCAYDRASLRERMGELWDTFVAYNVGLARSPKSKAASERYGWPLHVVEEAADDPFRDRPRAFLRALGEILEDFSRSIPATGRDAGRTVMPHKEEGS